MIEINNLTSFVVDKKLFTGIAKKVLKGENRETETLSLAFVSKNEMQKLNKKFRGKNKPTDVLSFSNVSGFKFQVSRENLGEIVICPEVVKENVPIARRQSRILDGKAVGTKKYKSDFEREMMKVFVHGILHLLGHDHEKSKSKADIMERKEEQYLSII